MFKRLATSVCVNLCCVRILSKRFPTSFVSVKFWIRGMQHTVEFWLPFPPSTNRLWRSVRGRVVLSPHYKDWKKRAVEAVNILQKLSKQPVLGTHELELKLSTAMRVRSDADNRRKADLDIGQDLMLIVD